MGSLEARNSKRMVTWGLYGLAIASTWTHLIATHLPRETAASILFDFGLVGVNEFIHFGTYAVTSMLWCFALWYSAPSVGHGKVWLPVFGWMTLLAVLDEITQPLVGRSAEVIDVAADVLGIAVGIATAGIVWLVYHSVLSRFEASPPLVQGPKGSGSEA